MLDVLRRAALGIACFGLLVAGGCARGKHQAADDDGAGGGPSALTDGHGAELRPWDGRGELAMSDGREPHSAHDGAAAPFNLVLNGDFAAGKASWSDASSTTANCGLRTASVVRDLPYASAIEVKSTDSSGCGACSAVSQTLAIEASSYSTLTLTAAVKAVSSTVRRTCGDAGNETPLNFELWYKDSASVDKEIRWQFYFSTGDATETCASPQPPANCLAIPVKVEKEQWYGFTSANILSLATNPRTFTRLVVVGCGWDYVGRATLIQLAGH